MKISSLFSRRAIACQAAIIAIGAGAALAQSPLSKGSIGDIVAKGGSVTCAIAHAGKEQAQGTIYASGGKVRGDFTAQGAKGPIESHMFSDGTTMYVWSSARPQGIKMAVPASGKSPAGTPPAAPPGNAQTQLYNESVDYSCAPWTADASKFVLPQNVSFMDVGAMMGGMKPQGAGGAPGAKPAGMPAMNCSLCDKAPAGAARDQCRAAMHCQ
jgi:hypothetical protein